MLCSLYECGLVSQLPKGVLDILFLYQELVRYSSKARETNDNAHFCSSIVSRELMSKDILVCSINRRFPTRIHLMKLYVRKWNTGNCSLFFNWKRADQNDAMWRSIPSQYIEKAFYLSSHLSLFVTLFNIIKYITHSWTWCP